MENNLAEIPLGATNPNPSEAWSLPATGVRVCVASTGLGHVARGIEAWANDLGRALARRGVDVTLCKGGGTESESFEKCLWCLQRESPASKRLRQIVPHRLFWRLGFASAYPLEQVSFVPGLVRQLRRSRTEILHVQDPLLALCMQRARRLRLIRTRTILAHGTEEPPEFLTKIDYLQHLAPFHAEAIRNAGIWRDNWTTIPNFVDVDHFRPGASPGIRRRLGIPEDALVLLSVAAIKRHHKRIDYLLQEFHALRARCPDLPVWLVIAGGWEAETDALIAEGTALLGDRVRFLVRYPRAEIPELYRAADVFVLASLFEMMPIALIEAQASGLPCLVHDHPNLQWAIGRGGESIDMGQSGALAQRLEEWLQSSSRRSALGALAREHCLETFSEGVVIDQILQYYDQTRADASRVSP